MSDVLLPHPFPRPHFGLQQSCYHKHQAASSDKTKNLMFTFIHCHYQLLSNTFLFLFSGQGVKDLLYKDCLLLGSLSSGLLQPGCRLLLHLTLHSDCNWTEYMTLDTVTDWPPGDSWLVSYWAWTGDEVLNVFCKTLFCVSAAVSHYKALSNSMGGCRGVTFAISAQVTQLNPKA